MHLIGTWFQVPFSSCQHRDESRRTWHSGFVKRGNRYGAAYSTRPTPTRDGSHVRSWCGAHNLRIPVRIVEYW